MSAVTTNKAEKTADFYLNTRQVIDLSFLLLVFLVPLAFYPQLMKAFNHFKYSLLVFMGLWILALMVFYWLTQDRSKGISIFTSLLLLYFSINTGSLLAPVNRYQAALELGNLAVYLTLCLWAHHRGSDDGFVKKFISVVALTALFHAGYGFLQYWGIDIVKLSVKRVPVSTLGNLNFVAQYLIGIFPPLLGFSLMKKGKIRLFYILVTTMIWFHLLLSHSRGGYVGFLVSMVFFLTLFIYLKGTSQLVEFWRRNIKQVVIIIGGVIALLGTFLFLDYGEAARQVGSIFAPGRDTNVYRLLTWRDTWRMTQAHPLVGVGIGNFQYVFPRYQSPALWEKEDVWGRLRKQRTHNDYLNILAETGFLGLAAFLAIMLFWLVNGLKAMQRWRQVRPEAGLLLTMFICSIIATLTQSLFDFNLYNPASAMIFWITLGLAVKQSELAIDTRQRRPESLDKSSCYQSTPIKISQLILACSLGGGLFILSLFYLNKFNFQRYIASCYDKQASNYFAKGQYEQASNLARRATLVADFDADAYQLQADALRHLGQYRAAATAYRQWRSLEPNFLTIYNRLAFCYIYLGDYQLAEQEYRQALDINPNSATVLVNLANLYFLQRSWSEALPFYERVRNLGHQLDQRDKFNYGEILFQQAKFTEAAKIFQELYAVQPDSLRVLERLGDCWWALNEPDKAQALYRRCLLLATGQTAQRLKQKLTGLKPE